MDCSQCVELCGLIYWSKLYESTMYSIVTGAYLPHSALYVGDVIYE